MQSSLPEGACVHFGMDMVPSSQEPPWGLRPLLGQSLVQVTLSGQLGFADSTHVRAAHGA